MNQLLVELCTRLRYMVEVYGETIDGAYDRTNDPEWIRAKRWINGEWHTTVKRANGQLTLIQWTYSGPMLYQDGDGIIDNRQLSQEEAQRLLITLRRLMVLDELADV